MAKQKQHWTERSTADFLYQIGADFIRQIETVMEKEGVNQADLAKRLKVSEGRVSQVLNNPGNLTLKKIVEYVRALGRKVAIVEYNDDDPNNQHGPVSAEIFAKCWYRAGMPTDFFALENGATNVGLYRVEPGPRYNWRLPIAQRAANSHAAGIFADEQVAGTEKIQIRVLGV
jgi:transcriptional regulator with XRE-family HTH domain